MSFAIRAALLATAFAIGTAGFGWWSVPLLAFAYGLAVRTVPRAAGAAAVGALAAWAALLLWLATRGPAGAFAGRLAGALAVPTPALLAVTLLFPALLAWSATALGQSLVTLLAPQRRAAHR